MLGQKYVGSGGFPAPGIGGSLENVLATAIVMDELGRRSVRNGTGKFYGHNHQGEFRATYTDPVTGDVKPAWQFVVENTDPRYVAFELDVLWATDGGADPVALLNRYASRIKMLHIKDGISVADPANATPVRWVRGRWTSARSSRPPGVASTTTSTSRTRRSGDPAFDPFVSARAGFTYLDCFRY